MRVSEAFHLGRSQPTLDFVDVVVSTDVPVFIDPKAIRIQETDWNRECEAMLQSFFAELLDAISKGDVQRQQRLLGRLYEPNETHLGFSKGRSRGRGLGGVGAGRIVRRFARSQAAQSNLLSDLEDTALLIDRIGPDIISDITTNVIRGALIGYTHRTADYYGIDMEPQHSGPVWNPDKLAWSEDYVDLPRADNAPLLLVPKSIVRSDLLLDKGKYFRGYLAPILSDIEIDAGSALVSILKNGQPRVYRDDLKKKYGDDKLAIVAYTERFPDALRRYKSSVTRTTSPPLAHDELSDKIDVPTPDYRDLVAKLQAISPGNTGATLYHRAVEKLLTSIFYPYLGNMKIEAEIHGGRKRIDILYDNLASGGTFYWLAANYKAAVIPVECKNYTRELKNEELDQISGRFSERRGWIGIITCRKFEDKDLFLDRCRDTAHDGRGYVIPLDDQDIIELAMERASVQDLRPRDRGHFKLLRERFDYLIT